ncbi:hypothetical protein ACHAPO_011514 [Fusarium lateritium]
MAEIFKDVENAPAVKMFHRDKANTIVFDTGFEQGHLTYAPSSRNPYYMAITRDKMGEMFNQQQMGKWATETTYPNRPTPGTAFLSYFNVSLKLFQDLADDSVDWLSLSRLNDPQVTKKTDTDDKAEAKILKEMAFDGLLDTPKNDPLEHQEHEEMMNTSFEIKIDLQAQLPPEENPFQEEDIVETLQDHDDITLASDKEKIIQEINNGEPRRIFIPVRHQKGWLCWLPLGTWESNMSGRLRQLKAIKKGFAMAWMMATAIDPDSAAGYRARFSSANLGFPLIVVPQTKTLSLRLNRGLIEVDSLFQRLVDDINNRVTQKETYLEVMKQHEVGGDGYVKMGENPFGLFTTYIATDSFNTYMKSLEVVRGHDEVLEGRDAHRYIDTSQKTVATINAWLKHAYSPMKGTDAAGKPNYTKAQINAMLAMQNWQSQAPNTNINDMLYVKYDDFGSTWSIDVGKDKINNARGNRNTKYAPGNIMGMSANQAAQEALGWKTLHKAFDYLGHDQRISSGFFMAEWLHLCAFSWGGLTRLSDTGKDLYRSSDIPGNLVLGTSETNSLMTRYASPPAMIMFVETYKIARFEKAWQTLVSDSLDLSSIDSCPRLTVTRNSNSKPVIRDAKNAITGDYSRQRSGMSDAEETLAKTYDFLAYTISYTLSFPKGCKLLRMGMPSSLHTMFYPFLRPLYHKLEDQLDQMLFEEMKNRDSINILGSLSKPVPHAINHLPYNQNGNTVYTGGQPYTNMGSMVGGSTSVLNNTNPHTRAGGDDGTGRRKYRLASPFN